MQHIFFHKKNLKNILTLEITVGHTAPFRRLEKVWGMMVLTLIWIIFANLSPSQGNPAAHTPTGKVFFAKNCQPILTMIDS